MRKCSASFLARAVPLFRAGCRDSGIVSVNRGQKHLLFSAGVSNSSRCGLVKCRRGLCSSDKPPLDFWLLPETKIGLDEIETKVEAYRQAPSPASLDAVQSVISVERHALELNGRVHGMLQSTFHRFLAVHASKLPRNTTTIYTAVKTRISEI